MFIDAKYNLQYLPGIPIPGVPGITELTYNLVNQLIKVSFFLIMSYCSIVLLTYFNVAYCYWHSEKCQFSPIFKKLRPIVALAAKCSRSWERMEVLWRRNVTDYFMQSRICNRISFFLSLIKIRFAPFELQENQDSLPNNILIQTNR